MLLLVAVPAALHASAPADTALALPVLANTSRAPNTVEVTLTASPARLSLVPGAATDVYAYNGSVPGPTLEVREGDRV
ncbi:MAG TPA: multicopper oxidase domain-containing protein, partial [Longimicrobiaceae bacterium]|nr:multicopper oxidase domain-containing protein [Longimicrobiaceae bacterium]